MMAFACAMVRSAAAISGRRWSSCEGTPTGIAGTGVVSIFTGIEKLEAGLPISVAMACSYKARLVAMPIPAASAFSSVTSA